MKAMFRGDAQQLVALQQMGLAGMVGAMVLVVLWVWATRSWSRKKQQRSSSSTKLLAYYPPRPPPWPVIGNLPILAGPQAYRRLAEMSRKYRTPVLSIRLGSTPALVACTADAARQFLQVHDAAFSGRAAASATAAERLLFGRRNAIGFQTAAGARWRELRRLWTSHLLSPTQIAAKSSLRQAEVSHMVDCMIRSTRCEPGGGFTPLGGGGGLDVLACVSDAACNIMGRIILSERLVETVGCRRRRRRHRHPLQVAVEDTVRLLFTPLLGDFVPLLSFLDAAARLRMRRLRARTARLLGSIVAARVAARSDGSRRPSPRDRRDILDMLLDYTSAATDHEHDHQAFLYTTIRLPQEMFIVGVDTAANAMGWVMAELLANPEEMRKVQEELAAVVGMGRMVADSDLNKLAYLRAAIKEVFRLHPVATMMIPHVSSEDREVEVDTMHSYNIRSGTMIFVNLWAIGRDGRVWDNPDAFTPARFIGSDIDLRGQHFELIPFGSGRRMCPGINLGLRVVELVLANLLHCFRWSPSTASVDLSETTSARTRALTLAKPLLALPTFRLQKSWDHVKRCSDS